MKSPKQYSNIRGIFTDITSVCKALKQAIYQCDQNSISMNFVKTNDETSQRNLDQLDPSFMYTQILKEILLTIHFHREHMEEFLRYCEEQCADNRIELENINKIKRD